MVLKRPPPALPCGCQGGLVNVRDWRTGANTHMAFVTNLSDHTLHFSKTMTLAFRIHMLCASQQASQTPYRVQDVY